MIEEPCWMMKSDDGGHWNSSYSCKLWSIDIMMVIVTVSFNIYIFFHSNNLILSWNYDLILKTGFVLFRNGDDLSYNMSWILSYLGKLRRILFRNITRIFQEKEVLLSGIEWTILKQLYTFLKNWKFHVKAIRPSNGISQILTISLSDCHAIDCSLSRNSRSILNLCIFEV